ncbi:MAG: MFS transporter [Spirochaetaceae bacterium]|nr:MAG: MFS transporter [Spirochaetaceae bacterium]
MSEKNTELPKGFYRITILIGLGFFTMGLMDPLYDTYVPIFLADFLTSRFLIGAIMTLDNLLALFLIPIVSNLSDNTHTPIGRRMPWILVTVPLSGIFFALLPYGALPSGSLVALILVIFVLNLAKQAARGPVVALMPDTIPGEYRSEANGVINTMGAIAAIVGTIVLAPLMDLDLVMPLIGSVRRRLPFLISGVLVIIATILLFAFVRESAKAREKRERTALRTSLRLVFGGEDRSAMLILLSLFFWFLGYQGVLPFMGIYSRQVLGVSEGLAGLSPGAVAIGYMLLAIPSGIIAHRFGRRRIIRFCLVGIVIALLLMFVHEPVTRALGLSPFVSWVIFLGILFFFGMFWGSVITNSFPMLWQMAHFGNMGIYTGLYYFFSQGAAITSPPISGAVIDLFTFGFGDTAGLRMIFLYSSIMMSVAFFIMGRVHGGEPGEPARNAGAGEGVTG